MISVSKLRSTLLPALIIGGLSLPGSAEAKNWASDPKIAALVVASAKGFTGQPCDKDLLAKVVPATPTSGPAYIKQLVSMTHAPSAGFKVTKEKITGNEYKVYGTSDSRRIYMDAFYAPAQQTVIIYNCTWQK